jgi:putative selenate reductase
MKLGEPDESGRRRPLPADETIELQIDTLITAIGEKVNVELLKSSGLETGADGWIIVNKETQETSDPQVYLGGDAYRGPSTVVESMSDGKRAAENIASKEIADWKGFDQKPKLKTFDKAQQMADISAKRGRLIPDQVEGINEALAEQEANRCLECNTICNKCVSVCPNRANVAITMGNGGFKDPYQILHLDALCNECGNCGAFCPYDGKPYKDKMTLFVRQDDFENSENNGFLFTDGDSKGTLRLNKSLYEFAVDSQGNANVSASGVDAATLAGIQQMIQAVRQDYGFYLINP